MVPLTAFMPNPNHNSGNARAKGLIGTAGQKPSTTRLIMALTPATMDIPRVWTMRIVGNAQTVGASLTHWLKAMFSRKTRNWCMYYSLRSLFLTFLARGPSIQCIGDNPDHGRYDDHPENCPDNQCHALPPP